MRYEKFTHKTFDWYTFGYDFVEKKNNITCRESSIGYEVYPLDDQERKWFWAVLWDNDVCSESGMARTRNSAVRKARRQAEKVYKNATTRSAHVEAQYRRNNA